MRRGRLYRSKRAQVLLKRTHGRKIKLDISPTFYYECFFLKAHIKMQEKMKMPKTIFCVIRRRSIRMYGLRVCNYTVDNFSHYILRGGVRWLLKKYSF